MSRKTLFLIYHSLFHTVMRCGIIFWGNSCHSMHIFRIQKRVIRIIRGCGNGDSCSVLLKKIKILPLMSQYILPLLYLWFVVSVALSTIYNDVFLNYILTDILPQVPMAN